MKVKSDHRSQFSNLSNWKEEAWKIQDFNGIRTRGLRDTGAMLYQLSYEANLLSPYLPWGVKYFPFFLDVGRGRRLPYVA